MRWNDFWADLQKPLEGLKLSSLGSKIVLWSFLPTAVILAAVAGATFWYYLQAAEQLAVTQNEDLARYAGGQLAADLEEYGQLLEQVSQRAGLGYREREEWGQALQTQANHLVVFRGGVLALDEEGRVAAAEPENPALLGMNYSHQTFFTGLIRGANLYFSDTIQEGPMGVPVVGVSIPITSLDGSTRGYLVGFFQLGETAVSSFYGDLIKLRPGGDGRAYLVDSDGIVLFHNDSSFILVDRSENPVVNAALSGETGASRLVNERGENVLASYAPVPGTDWGLVIEQGWYTVVGPIRSQEVMLATLFLIGVIVPGIIVSRGVRNITRPIVELVESAQRIASGEYIEPKIDDEDSEVGELATQFTKVSDQLRAAHEDLEKRVEMRTRELSMLLGAIQGASSSLELDEVLSQIAESLAEAARVSACVIFLLDEESQQLLPAGSWRRPGTDARSDGLFQMPLDPSRDPLTAQVLDTARPSISSDPEDELLRRSGLSHIMGVPFVSKGNVLAVAVLGSSDQSREFTEAELDLSWGIATTAAVSIENAQLYLRLQDKVRELEGLYQADEELHRYLDLDAVLQSLVDVSVDILGADKSSILVWNESEQTLRVKAAKGFQASTMRRMTFELGEGAVGRVPLTREPLLVEDSRAAEHVAARVTEGEGIRAFMHIPVEIGGKFFGVFNVDYLAPRKFREDEVRGFTALAQRAALAIENARLYGQSRELAVIEERQRLARDLHDAVTQTLFSASLTAEVLPKIWERDQAEGSRRLEELRQLTRGALAEMRTLLLELRPSTLTETDLTDLLKQLSEALTSRASIQVELTTEGSCPMPPEVQVGIYRIAQEALNNIAKHAEASEVKILLRCDPAAGLSLSIQDDGKGFDAQERQADCLGLEIMNERADEIGAKLNIQSERGSGTAITLQWENLQEIEKNYE